MIKHILGLLFMSVIVSAADAQKRLTSYKKILFLGNSVTYDGKYITGMEAYLTLKYQQSEFEIINMGLPSETVSGLSEPGHADNRFPRPDLRERLSRILLLVKPDLVLASYGINDGIYMPFDDGRFAKYNDGIRWLHNEVTKSGAEVMHVTSPYYDERRAGNAGYGNTMDKYAQWLTSMKDSGWNVIDIYNPMKEYLNAHRSVDEKYHLDGFELAGDGVHPDPNAHWLMARTILGAMGESEVSDVVSIESFAADCKNGKDILEKIQEKQAMMKDAWLTAAGHKRPEMKKGLPLREAKEKEEVLEKEIELLTK